MKIYSTGEVCNKPGDSDPTKCYRLDPGTEHIDLIHPLVHREIMEQSPIIIRLCLCQFFITLTKWVIPCYTFSQTYKGLAKLI